MSKIEVIDLGGRINCQNDYSITMIMFHLSVRIIVTTTCGISHHFCVILTKARTTLADKTRIVSKLNVEFYEACWLVSHLKQFILYSIFVYCANNICHQVHFKARLHRRYFCAIQCNFCREVATSKSRV